MRKAFALLALAAAISTSGCSVPAHLCRMWAKRGGSLEAIVKSPEERALAQC